MILKNDLTHLQSCILKAVKKESLTAIEGMRKICEWIQEGRFDENDRAINQDWFMDRLREYPLESEESRPRFKFKEYEPVVYQLTGYPVPQCGAVVQRFPRGKKITPAVCALIQNSFTPKSNMYLIDDSFDPQAYFLIPEHNMRLMTERESKNLLKH